MLFVNKKAVIINGLKIVLTQIKKLHTPSFPQSLSGNPESLCFYQYRKRRWMRPRMFLSPIKSFGDG